MSSIRWEKVFAAVVFLVPLIGYAALNDWVVPWSFTIGAISGSGLTLLLRRDQETKG